VKYAAKKTRNRRKIKLHKRLSKRNQIYMIEQAPGDKYVDQKQKLSFFRISLWYPFLSRKMQIDLSGREQLKLTC